MERNRDKETEIVAKFVKSIGFHKREGIKVSEDEFNARILAPICLIDVAYGILQDKVFKAYQYRQKCKQLMREILNIFADHIYHCKGTLYGALNTDEVYYLSEYSEMQAELIKDDVDRLYWQLSDYCHDMEDFKQRDIQCNLMVAATLLYMVDNLMQIDWLANYGRLKVLTKKVAQFGEEWRRQCIKKKDVRVLIEDDNPVQELVNAINSKIRLIS